MENQLFESFSMHSVFKFQRFAVLISTNRRGAGAGEEDARILVCRIIVGLAAIIDPGRPFRLGNMECSRRGKMARLAFLE